jgi:hypothetical protein
MIWTRCVSTGPNLRGTAHWDQDVRVGFSDPFQVSGDCARGHEEDTVGEVLGGEQGALAESLLAEVKNSRPAKCGWPAMMKGTIIDIAAMQRKTDGLLPAVSDRFSGRLISRDGDQRDFAWCRLAGLRGDEWKVDLFDDAEHGFRYKRRAIESVLDI